jgi:hypothetical protein
LPVADANVYPMQAVTYRKRGSTLLRGELEWLVEDDALITHGPTGRVGVYRTLESSDLNGPAHAVAPVSVTVLAGQSRSLICR